MAVGKQRQQYMHTISAGPADAPPMVLVPGYGAGAAFYFRNLDGLAAHFRTHAVDLLGTGMSGVGLLTVVTRSRLRAFGDAIDLLGTSMLGIWLTSQE